jgi:hypothetical protein
MFTFLALMVNQVLVGPGSRDRKEPWFVRHTDGGTEEDGGGKEK